MSLRCFVRCCSVGHLSCVNRIPRSYRSFSSVTLDNINPAVKKSDIHSSRQRIDHSNKQSSTHNDATQSHDHPKSTHSHKHADNSSNHSYNHSTSQSSNLSQNQSVQEPATAQSVETSQPKINPEQAEAMFQRGLQWFTGQFGRIDYSAAYIWYEQSATAKHAPAVNRLAVMHLLGYGCEKNVERAMELFREAARLGDVDAANHLAALLQSSALSSKRSKWAPYDKQPKVPYDKSTNQDKMREAADLFEQAARAGHSRAALSLAKLILVGNSRPLAYDQALIWLEQAAEGKLSEAAYLAGLVHMHRPPVFPGASSDKAVSAVMEQVYASRFRVVPLNLTRGFELLNQAAELGSSEAHCELGDWYLSGTSPLTSINESIAASHYRAAAEVGNAVGQARLAMMIANGVGVERDRNNALLWLTTAANSNNNDALLGLMYLTLTQPDINQSTEILDSNGRRELTEKQSDFIQEMLAKVSESIYSSTSSAPEVKAGISALKRNPWLLVDAMRIIEESTGKPWIKGTDELMTFIPRAK